MWMPAFAFMTLMAAGIYVIVFSNNRSYQRGRLDGIQECTDKIASLTAELERFRDELLKRDAHTFIHSL